AEHTTCSTYPGHSDFSRPTRRRPSPDNEPVDDRALHIAVLLSAHVIFLSAAALRIIRGQRGHQLVTRAPWWVQYYPPLVWLPFLVAYFAPIPLDIDRNVQLGGLAIALVSALFA